MDIAQATSAYEAWMRRCTEVVEAHLQLKHERMRDDEFMFFRGTFYRWAQIWPTVCRDLVGAPTVLAVGDLHVGSFGTWRDAEGRLCWGVDDFDESYRLPYTNDLVRLAASAKVAIDAEHLRIKHRDACHAILDGYRQTLRRGGCPLVLAERETNLERFGLEAIRPPKDFWRRLQALPVRRHGMPRSVTHTLKRTLPAVDLRYKVVRREAGLGSLGQRRFVAIAQWNGGLIAREAKAMVPSAFSWLKGDVSDRQPFYRHVMTAAVRSRDPFQPSTQNPQDIQQTYAKLCGGCHGDDARGTQQGPGLAGNASVRARSPQSLRNVIRNGIPAGGMPAFDLPADTLDALAAMIGSLNAVAAKSSLPGDAAAGRQFFFGKGQCASCHLVQGEGSPIGPDLSDIGLELTVDEIREALVNPDARIAPGYGMVSVRLRTGRTLRGFARSRSSFDLAIQDLTGAIHTLSLDEVSAITDETRSYMQRVTASADELRDVMAFLSRLTGVQPGVLASRRLSETRTDSSTIMSPTPGDWLTYNGNVSGNRYSELAQINKANVGKLGVKWTFTIPLWSQLLPDTPYYRENMRYFGLETVPIVADGIMYVTGPNQVFALDARTGLQIWHYTRPRSTDLISDAALGTNRGVAILGDLVFMVTDNAHLIALHRVTGRPVWEVVMPDEPQRYGGTMAPLIVKDMVIAGVSGGDWGIRGFLSAYKADTGERVWRHWTIPAKGDPGFETWKGTAVATGGGATWQTGSYDPETDTLYWAAGNPWPNSDDRERGGDNLFTDCVLALDPATGKLKWYYQFTPHDTRDWDANEPNVLVNALFRGQERKLLLHADRNGFFYVLDRSNGQLLLAEKFVRRLTWASGIGADGRPVRLPEGDVRCPDHATNWHGTAFSPATRLYYVQATERCVVRSSPGSWKTERPRVDPATRYLRALDIETGKTVWEIPQAGPVDGKRDAGVLGTAAGILFYGDASGYLVAVDERDGKALWRAPLNATIKTSPMTFAIGGHQFIALAVGSNIVCFGL